MRATQGSHTALNTSPVTREIGHWTDQSVAALQDRLNDIGWEMFRHSSDDIDMFTEVIVGYIGKLMDDTVEKICTFLSQKA